MDSYVTHKIVDPPGVILSPMFGEVHIDQLLGHIDALAADPAFRPGLLKLVDMRQTTYYDLSAADERRFYFYKLKKGVKESRLAFAAPDDTSYGMSRLYQSIAQSDDNIGVFRTIEKALAWLDLPESILDEVPTFETASERA